MVENRRRMRISCDGKLLVSHKRGTTEAEVLDLSQTGMRVSIKEKLTVGQYVCLRFPGRALGGKSLRAVVRWIQLGHELEAGLEFLSPDGKWSKRWLNRLCPEVIDAGLGVQKRTNVRAPISLPIALDDYREGLTIDLSRSGAKFELSAKLEEDTKLFLCLPKALLELHASIVRSEDTPSGWMYSVKFDELPEAQADILDGFIREQHESDRH